MENIARFDVDTNLKPPLTKYNAVMEFLLSKGADDSIIAKNYVFPTKIKDAVGVKNPKIKVSKYLDESIFICLIFQCFEFQLNRLHCFDSHFER